MTASFRIVPTRHDLSGIREEIAGVLAPGAKMTFARLAADREDVGLRLMRAFAEDLEPIAAAHFGEPATALLPLGTVRHHTTQAVERAPWHYDEVFFRGADGRGLTFWLTLDDAGERAPSVEFDIEGEFIAPVVPAGSALVFEPSVRHRTQPIDGDRISAEFRVVPTSIAQSRDHYREIIQASAENRSDSRWLVIRRGQGVRRERLG